MVNRVLIYGDLVLNIIDGSSIWVVNLAKLIAQDKSNRVDILLKEPIKNDVLVSDLKEIPNVRLVSASIEENLSKDNIAKALDEVDGKNRYHSIIVRGLDAVNAVVKTKHKDKLIPYITDFNQNIDEITYEEKAQLAMIYESVDKMFVQTEEMRDYYIRLLNVDGEKCYILNPIVFPLPPVEKEKKTLCYSGKLAKFWNIEELVELMDILAERDPEIKLYFVGNKFNTDLRDKRDEIIKYLKTADNVKYYPKLPNSKSKEIINKCELGYCFRDAEIDNDSSLELSIKFLEYGIHNVAPIVRRTRMYSKILGDDYPLFVESTEDMADKIIDYFNDSEGETDIDLEERFRDFSVDRIYANVSEVLDFYNKKNPSVFKKFINKLF